MISAQPDHRGIREYLTPSAKKYSTYVAIVPPTQNTVLLSTKKNAVGTTTTIRWELSTTVIKNRKWGGCVAEDIETKGMGGWVLPRAPTSCHRCSYPTT